jgi:hypothetical protein
MQLHKTVLSGPGRAALIKVTFAPWWCLELVGRGSEFVSDVDDLKLAFVLAKLEVGGKQINSVRW